MQSRQFVHVKTGKHSGMPDKAGSEDGTRPQFHGSESDLHAALLLGLFWHPERVISQSALAVLAVGSIDAACASRSKICCAVKFRETNLRRENCEIRRGRTAAWGQEV